MGLQVNWSSEVCASVLGQKVGRAECGWSKRGLGQIRGGGNWSGGKLGLRQNGVVAKWGWGIMGLGQNRAGAKSGRGKQWLEMWKKLGAASKHDTLLTTRLDGPIN